LSDHEDAFVSDIELSDHGCRDLFTHSCDHDFDFSAVDFSKTLVLDDLSFDDLDLSQDVRVVEPELMVMLSSRSLEVSSNSDQNSDVSFKTPHHFATQIENHFVS